MEKIKKYLNDPKRTLKDGIELYNEFGRNKNIKKLFESKRPDEFKMIKVLHELRKLAGVKEVVVVQVTKPILPMKMAEKIKAKPQAEHQKKTIDIVDVPDDAPDLMKAKVQRIKEISPLIQVIHGKMKAAKNDKERLEYATEITTLENEQMDLWIEVDEWSESKKPKSISDVEKERKKLEEDIKDAEEQLANPKIHGNKRKSLSEKLSGWREKFNKMISG